MQLYGFRQGISEHQPASSKIPLPFYGLYPWSFLLRLELNQKHRFRVQTLDGPRTQFCQGFIMGSDHKGLIRIPRSLENHLVSNTLPKSFQLTFAFFSCVDAAPFRFMRYSAGEILPARQCFSTRLETQIGTLVIRKLLAQMRCHI